VDAGRLKAWKTLGGHRRIEASSAEMLFEAHAQVSRDAGAQAALSASAASPLRVVIVDDNAIDRELLAQLVVSALPEASITMAENGFQGLVSIGRTAPDIVVTDIHMPHMNGVEMIRHLWHDESIKPRILVAVSAHVESELSSIGPMPADVVFLNKPVDSLKFSHALLRPR
jgi:CheY-like chemotaxis protein